MVKIMRMVSMKNSYTIKAFDKQGILLMASTGVKGRDGVKAFKRSAKRKYPERAHHYHVFNENMGMKQVAV